MGSTWGGQGWRPTLVSPGLQAWESSASQGLPCPGWADAQTLNNDLLPICSSKKAGATAKGKVGGRWK